MLGTVELQVRTSTFLATQIAKYRTTPWCPPPAQYGVQLQRVRFAAAVIRQTVPDEFAVFWRNYYGDVAPLQETAKGFKTQLDLELELDVTTQAAAAANPNAMPPDLAVLRPHVIFDLYAIPSEIEGCVLVMNRSGIEWPPGSTPALPPLPVPLPPGITPASLLNPLILSMLPSITVPVNLNTGTLGASNIINAGIAADLSGNRLVLRAEAFTGSDNPTRWTNFHRGATADRLGSSEWSLFIKAADMKQLLNISFWNGLRDEIDPSGKAHVISCATEYYPGNATATFTTTVFLRVTPPFVPDFTEEVPLVTTFSLDAATGEVVVDVWLKGIEDLVDDATTIFNMAVSFVAPFLAIPLRVLFGEGRSYVEDELNGVSPGDIGALKFKHVSPYVLRATMPVPSPKLLGPGARIAELSADTDGFSLRGIWPLVTLTNSNLTVKSDGFEWRGPEFSCSQASRDIGRRIRDNPVQLIRLTASIVLGQTGQLPISLCSAMLMNDPSETGPEVQLSFTPSNVPTTVSLAASGSWANAHPNQPLTLELRTSNGALNVVIPACGRLKPGIITAIAGGAEIKVRNCERVIPEAFTQIRRGAKFDLAWIEHPLVDPPRPGELSQSAGDFELWSVQASGLNVGDRLFLGTTSNNQIRGARADARGQVSLAGMFPGGNVPVLSGTLSQGVHRTEAPPRRSVETSDENAENARTQGLSVFRQRYVLGGSLSFGTVPRDLVALPGLGRGRFAALVDEHVIDIAARTATSPRQLGIRRAEGAHRLLALTDGVLAYGGCGAMMLNSDGTSRPLGELGVEVLDAAVVGDRVVLVRSGSLETRALRGGCAGTTRAIEAMAVAEHAGQLLVAGKEGISMSRGVALDALRRLHLDVPGQVTRLISTGGNVLAQLDGKAWVRVDFRARTLETIDGLPWELRFPVSAGVAAMLSEKRRCIDFFTVREARGATPRSAPSAS